MTKLILEPMQDKDIENIIIRDAGGTCYSITHVDTFFGGMHADNSIYEQLRNGLAVVVTLTETQ